MLTIPVVKKDDIGLYTCRATNTLGGVECTAELIVDGR